MINMKLKADTVQTLYFDQIRGGRAQFIPRENHYVADISDREFDGFLKDNNLITYRNTLKGYQDGEVFGEFEVK